jgi:transglutaminase-like putative cysteine protease
MQMTRRITLIIAGFSLLLILQGHGFACVATDAPSQSLSNPKTYRVTYSFTFKIKRTIDRLEIWLPQLAEWDTQQDVTTEDVFPDPTEDYTEPVHGNGVYYWNLQHARSTLRVGEQYVCTLYDYALDMDELLIGEYDTESELYKLYTRHEEYVEAADPDIQATTREIVGEETNPYRKARLVYDWVIQHMTYCNVDGLVGARFALEHGYGECGDYAVLFCALLRAVGVPARPVFGFWARSGSFRGSFDTIGWHVWAEFYLPGEGWVPADPERGDNALLGSADDYFACLDGSNRLIASKNVNVPLPGEDVVPFFQSYLYHREGGQLKDWKLQLSVERIDN